MKKKLTLSKDKILFGVCGGVAEHLDIDPSFVRLITIILLFTSFPIIILYIILALILPDPI